MAKEHILVVEDEKDILELIIYNLVKDGYTATGVVAGEDVIEVVERHRPDLILLDLMLPEMDGLEVCRRLKGDIETRDIPVIMVTAKGEESDIVAGLELGAEDYVTKPFSPRELIARVRAVLRRAKARPPDESSDIRIHDIVIRPNRHEVLVGGHQVELTSTEFRLLSLLARRPGWVFTRYQIVDAIHGGDYAVTDRSIDVQVMGLRKKLGEAGARIETVRGVGYRFRE